MALGVWAEQRLGDPRLGLVLSSDVGLTLGLVRSLGVLGDWLGVLVSAEGRMLLLLLMMMMMMKALLRLGLGPLGGTVWGKIVGGGMRGWVQRGKVCLTFSTDAQSGHNL